MTVLKKIAVLILFIIQVYLVVDGIAIFSIKKNPVALFIVSIAMAVLAFNMLLTEKKGQATQGKLALKNILLGGLVAAICILAFYGKFYAVFNEYKNYAEMSDVIPQLETLFGRFSRGVFPYAPLEQYPWHPYPVYMPLNWLPVGLVNVFNCDVRWIGVFFWTIAAVLWGESVFRKNNGIALKVLTIAVLAIPLYIFFKFRAFDMAATMESLIAAYYLVLAVGLLGRNLTLITIGIICCLLSRYTMMFWLPLFFLLLWFNAPRKNNYKVWVAIALSILLIYLVPFYFQDPSILTKGIAYHNHCYVDAWNGLGKPENSTAFDDGLNFSWFIREYTSGTMEHRVSIGRGIQAILMIGLLISGVVLYRKWKNKLNFYDHSLVMLYCFLLLFFMFSPLTYRYYYLPLFMVSAVLVGRVWLSPTKLQKE